MAAPNAKSRWVGRPKRLSKLTLNAADIVAACARLASAGGTFTFASAAVALQVLLVRWWAATP